MSSKSLELSRPKLLIGEGSEEVLFFNVWEKQQRRVIYRGIALHLML